MSNVITITGIPGAGSTDFCKRYAAIDKPQSHRASDLTPLDQVKIYNVGDMIFEYAQNVPHEPPIPRENLMNLHPKVLNDKRDRAYEKIFSDLKAEHNYGNILVDTHAQFFWNDVLHNAYNWKHLNELKSDMYITLIDKPSAIKERQNRGSEGRTQDHDYRDLLLWQNMEVNVTKGWAENYSKPMYVLPAKQDPIILDSLLENFFLIYFQMPMTDASGPQDNQISDFKARVLEVGKELTGRITPLIDPRDFDMETGQGLPDRIERIIRRQTTFRDLDWYIPQATDVIAIYPKGTSISKGVSDESTRGFETGKDAYVIFPVKETSPFMELHKRVFENEKEFFTFFKGYMEQRLDFYCRDKW